MCVRSIDSKTPTTPIVQVNSTWTQMTNNRKNKGKIIMQENTSTEEETAKIATGDQGYKQAFKWNQESN